MTHIILRSLDATNHVGQRYFSLAQNFRHRFIGDIDAFATNVVAYRFQFVLQMAYNQQRKAHERELTKRTVSIE